MTCAVLFIVFNRPESTKRVFEAIRSSRPSRLYVTADGPRPGIPTDAARCNLVRKIVESVDWECETHYRFSDRNLGCRVGVSEGIDWFFMHEEEGIILEDDVVPTPDFFQFCGWLLKRYRSDDTVSAISGCNLISSHYSPDHSYFFSRYCHVWGWATWRRAWKHYDVRMTSYPEWRAKRGLEATLESRAARWFWSEILDKAHRGLINTWDYQWQYTCWRQDSLCIIPRVNLTTNIGFDSDATHTTGSTPSYVAESSTGELHFPLDAPHQVARDAKADCAIERWVFGISLRTTAAAMIRRIWSRYGARR